jgi:hypothetical protein
VPLFYFNVQDGSTPDPEGYDLPDLATARTVAVQTACAIVSQNAGQLLSQGEWQMTVCDETGLVLFTLTFFTTDAPSTQTVTIGHPAAMPGD